MTLFPKRAKADGSKRPLVGFRPPPDVETYLKGLKDRGYGTTEAVVELLRLGRDAESELGSSLQDVQVIAARDGVTVGRAIGRLALLGLKSRK